MPVSSSDSSLVRIHSSRGLFERHLAPGTPQEQQQDISRRRRLHQNHFDEIDRTGLNSRAMASRQRRGLGDEDVDLLYENDSAGSHRDRDGAAAHSRKEVPASVASKVRQSNSRSRNLEDSSSSVGKGSEDGIPPSRSDHYQRHHVPRSQSSKNSPDIIRLQKSSSVRTQDSADTSNTNVHRTPPEHDAAHRHHSSQQNTNGRRPSSSAGSHKAGAFVLYRVPTPHQVEMVEGSESDNEGHRNTPSPGPRPHTGEHRHRRISTSSSALRQASSQGSRSTQPAPHPSDSGRRRLEFSEEDEEVLPPGDRRAPLLAKARAPTEPRRVSHSSGRHPTPPSEEDASFSFPSQKKSRLPAATHEETEEDREPTEEELMQRYFHPIVESEDDESAARRRIRAEDGGTESDQSHQRERAFAPGSRSESQQTTTSHPRRHSSVVSHGGGRRLSLQYLRKAAAVPHVGELRRPRRMATPLALRRHRKEAEKKSSAERSISGGSEEAPHYEPPPPTTAGAHPIPKTHYPFMQQPFVRPTKPLSPLELPSPPRPRRHVEEDDEDDEAQMIEEVYHRKEEPLEPSGGSRFGRYTGPTKIVTITPIPTKKRSKSTPPSSLSRSTTPTSQGRRQRNNGGAAAAVSSAAPVVKHHSPPPPALYTEDQVRMKVRSVREDRPAKAKRSAGPREADRLPTVHAEESESLEDDYEPADLGSIVDEELRRKEKEMRQRKKDLERRKRELQARREEMERHYPVLREDFLEDEVAAQLRRSTPATHSPEARQPLRSTKQHRHRHEDEPEPRRPEHRRYKEMEEERGEVDPTRHQGKPRSPAGHPHRSRKLHAEEVKTTYERQPLLESSGSLQGSVGETTPSPTTPTDRTMMMKIPYQQKKHRSTAGGREKNAIVWSAEHSRQPVLSTGSSDGTDASTGEIAVPHSRVDTARGGAAHHRRSEDTVEDDLRYEVDSSDSFRLENRQRHLSPSTNSNSVYSRTSKVSQQRPRGTRANSAHFVKPKSPEHVVQYTKIKNLIPYEPPHPFGMPQKLTDSADSSARDSHRHRSPALGRVDVNTTNDRHKYRSGSLSSDSDDGRPPRCTAKKHPTPSKRPPLGLPAGVVAPPRRWVKGDPHDAAYFQLPANMRFEFSPYLEPYFPKKSNKSRSRSRSLSEESEEVRKIDSQQRPGRTSPKPVGRPSPAKVYV